MRNKIALVCLIASLVAPAMAGAQVLTGIQRADRPDDTRELIYLKGTVLPFRIRDRDMYVEVKDVGRDGKAKPGTTLVWMVQVGRLIFGDERFKAAPWDNVDFEGRTVEVLAYLPLAPERECRVMNQGPAKGRGTCLAMGPSNFDIGIGCGFGFVEGRFSTVVGADLKRGIVGRAEDCTPGQTPAAPTSSRRLRTGASNE